MNQKPEQFLKGKNILIVEDDPVSSEFLKEILFSYEAELNFANSAETAISICKENKNIDLVLMDIRLPGKSGYEATQEIKKHRPGLPIIAQTAYAFESDKDKAIGAGCDYYISKPIKAKDLLVLIEKALQSN